MKSLEEIKVSVYENVYSKKPKTMSLMEVISMCIHPDYANIIRSIRRYHEEGNHEAAQKIKSQLPCFTPAGTFNGAHAIKNFLIPSLIVGLDYDHVPNRLEVIRKCADDPHTVAALESPTDGVKVFAFVENTERRHREAQQLVSRYYDQLLGLQSDPACKDESRLCYFTYSPNGYIASLYQTFELEKADTTATIENTSDSSASQSITNEEIKKYLSSYIFLKPLIPGQRHTNLFKLACEACRRHYPEEDILRELSSILESTDFSFGELKSIVSAGYQKVSSSASTKYRPISSATQSVKVPKVHYDAIENDNDAEDSYWQGEEFRKNTPLLPKELYDNLPNLLDECIIEDEGDREKDVAFLSVLITLSASMPQTFGIYNHKKYSPHLFAIVSSPAGSGKSIAQVGRYLLEEIQSEILSESLHNQQKYQTAHSQWLAECSKSKKDQTVPPEEPQRPPFKMLIIPATTSYTRMQIQMQDNGTQGSIIFDTEAQTLSTANHLDCGNFDDMLRKAFEHENIDSSYKANGIVPISVAHPRLAMFLTGTPGQVENLITTSENGLTSRILPYTFRGIPVWKEMGDDSVSLEDQFKPLAHQVLQLYHFCLDHPMLFHFSFQQWKHFNLTFSRLLSEVVLENNDDLQAVVKRYAFMVMRISMILTRIRQFEKQDPSPEITCQDADFLKAMQIILCCYEHSRLLLSAMPSPATRPLKNPDSVRLFFDDLSDSFNTDDAIRVGANHGFSRSKVMRLLKATNGVRINKIAYGSYTKLPS